MTLAFKDVELYQNEDNNSISQHLPAIIGPEKNIDNIDSNRYQKESTYVKVWTHGVYAFAKATAGQVGVGIVLQVSGPRDGHD